MDQPQLTAADLQKALEIVPDDKPVKFVAWPNQEAIRFAGIQYERDDSDQVQAIVIVLDPSTPAP